MKNISNENIVTLDQPGKQIGNYAKKANKKTKRSEKRRFLYKRKTLVPKRN